MSSDRCSWCESRGHKRAGCPAALDGRPVDTADKEAIEAVELRGGQSVAVVRSRVAEKFRDLLAMHRVACERVDVAEARLAELEGRA